ncbi:MAG: hypothetical protein AAF682_31535, partial [Planctomycetota bacterium]
GLAAGLLFALSAGGLQAVHWPAAGGDLLVAAAGAGALCAYLAGRPVAGLLLLAAAVLAKATGLLVAPAVVVALAGARRARPEAVAPGAVRAAALGAAGLCALALGLRWLFVGSLGLSYGVARDALPPAGELARSAGGVFVQALMPLERAAELRDLAPAAALLPGGAPWAVLAFALPLAAGLLGGARRRVALLLGLALVLALPAAALFPGAGTNYQSRHLYPALLPLFAAVAAGLEPLLARRFGRVALGLALVVAADGTVHVARVEHASARVLRAGRAALAEAARAHAEDAASDPERPSRALTVLVVRGTDGQGSTLLWTPVALDAGLAPPFRFGPPLRVRGVPDRGELGALLAAGELIALDACVFGPDERSFTPPAAAGAARRRELALRRWTPTARGLASPGELARAEVKGQVSRASAPDGRPLGWDVSFGAPLPGTAARIFELRFAPGPEECVEVTPHYATGATGATSVARLPAGDDQRVVTFALAPELALGFEPLLRLRLRGRPPREARLLCRLPRVELAAGEALDLAGGPPRLELRLPPGTDAARCATRARVELVLRPPAERLPLCADFELGPPGPLRARRRPWALDAEGGWATEGGSDAPGGFGGAALTLVPERVHFEPRLAVAPRSSYAWGAVVDQHILPRLAAAGRSGGDAFVRVRLLHPGGLEAARSPWCRVPFRAR